MVHALRLLYKHQIMKIQLESKIKNYFIHLLVNEITKFIDHFSILI